MALDWWVPVRVKNLGFTSVPIVTCCWWYWCQPQLSSYWFQYVLFLVCLKLHLSLPSVTETGVRPGVALLWQRDPCWRNCSYHQKSNCPEWECGEERALACSGCVSTCVHTHTTDGLQGLGSYREVLSSHTITCTSVCLQCFCCHLCRYQVSFGSRTSNSNFKSVTEFNVVSFLQLKWQRILVFQL